MLEGLRLGAGQALVEPSSGNAGFAFAALANARAGHDSCCFSLNRKLMVSR